MASNLYPLNNDTLNKCTGCIAWLSNYATSVASLHTVNESTDGIAAAKERNKVEVEGLFRTPPNASSFAVFKQGLAAVDATSDHRGVKSFLARKAHAFDDKSTADCVASLLKLLLRDMEVSLVPFDYALRPAPRYIALPYDQCSTQEREENAVQATQELVLAMCQHLDGYPADVIASSVRVVGQLLALLCTVSRVDSIRMPPDNLFVPFLPSLCGSRDPLEVLEEHSRIAAFKDSPDHQVAHLERLIEYGHRVWGCIRGSISQLEEALVTMMAPVTNTRARVHTDRKRDMFKRIFGMTIRRNSNQSNPSSVTLDQFGSSGGGSISTEFGATSTTTPVSAQESSLGLPFGELVVNGPDGDSEPTWLAAGQPKPVQHKHQQQHGRLSLAFLFPARVQPPNASGISSADRVRALPPAVRARLLRRATSSAGIDEDSLHAARLAGLSNSSGAFPPTQVLAQAPRAFAGSSVSTDTDCAPAGDGVGYAAYAPVAAARSSSDGDDFEAAFARGSTRLSSSPLQFAEDIAASTLFAIESLLAKPSISPTEPQATKKKKKKKKKKNGKKKVNNISNQVDSPKEVSVLVESNTNAKPPRRRSSHKHTRTRRKSHTKRHGSASKRKLEGRENEEMQMDARQLSTIQSMQGGGVNAEGENIPRNMFVASDGKRRAATGSDTGLGDVDLLSRTILGSQSSSALRRKKSSKGNKNKTRHGTSNQLEMKTWSGRVGSGGEQEEGVSSEVFLRQGISGLGRGARIRNTEYGVVTGKVEESEKRRHRHKQQQVRGHAGTLEEEREDERMDTGSKKQVSSRPILNKAQGSLKRRGKKLIDLPGDEELRRLSEQGRALLQRVTSTST